MGHRSPTSRPQAPAQAPGRRPAVPLTQGRRPACCSERQGRQGALRRARAAAAALRYPLLLPAGPRGAQSGAALHYCRASKGRVAGSWAGCKRGGRRGRRRRLADERPRSNLAQRCRPAGLAAPTVLILPHCRCHPLLHRRRRSRARRTRRCRRRSMRLPPRPRAASGPASRPWSTLASVRPVAAPPVVCGQLWHVGSAFSCDPCLGSLMELASETLPRRAANCCAPLFVRHCRRGAGGRAGQGDGSCEGRPAEDAADGHGADDEADDEADGCSPGYAWLLLCSCRCQLLLREGAWQAAAGGCCVWVCMRAGRAAQQMGKQMGAPPDERARGCCTLDRR